LYRGSNACPSEHGSQNAFHAGASTVFSAAWPPRMAGPSSSGGACKGAGAWRWATSAAKFAAGTV